MSPSAVATLDAVVVIGVTVFARAELFRPKVKSAYSTNLFVRVLMDVCAGFCAWVAFELWGYSEAIPEGIVWLMAVFAITSTAMLLSMLVHDGRMVVAQVRAEDIGDMKSAVPPAIEAAIPQVFKDLAVVPDPYRPGEPNT